MSKKYVSKEVAKEIHEKAAPIIKWLREAEEESSDSEEEELEVRLLLQSSGCRLEVCQFKCIRRYIF